MTSWEFQYFQCVTSFKNAPYQTVVTNTWWSSVRLILTQEQRRRFGVFLKSKSKNRNDLKTVLPYLAIYHKFGYFWHQFATKFLFDFFASLATFLATFESLAKNQFKTGFGSVSFCFDVDILAFWKSFDVDIYGFQKYFDVGLLGFSKIWLLLAQNFWQHCLKTRPV